MARTNENIYEIAENMAAAIREWNRAKQERESWKPVPGQVPPVGILGSAKKANTMLSKALEEYESFRLGGAGEGRLRETARQLVDYYDAHGAQQFHRRFGTSDVSGERFVEFLRDFLAEGEASNRAAPA